MQPCDKCGLSKHPLPTVNALPKSVQAVFGIVDEGPKAKKRRIGNVKMARIITGNEIDESLKGKEQRGSKKQSCKISTETEKGQEVVSSAPKLGNNVVNDRYASTKNNFHNIDPEKAMPTENRFESDGHPARSDHYYAQCNVNDNILPSDTVTCRKPERPVRSARNKLHHDDQFVYDTREDPKDYQSESDTSLKNITSAKSDLHGADVDSDNLCKICLLEFPPCRGRKKKVNRCNGYVATNVTTGFIVSVPKYLFRH